MSEATMHEVQRGKFCREQRRSEQELATSARKGIDNTLDRLASVELPQSSGSDPTGTGAAKQTEPDVPHSWMSLDPTLLQVLGSDTTHPSGRQGKTSHCEPGQNWHHTHQDNPIRLGSAVHTCEFIMRVDSRCAVCLFRSNLPRIALIGFRGLTNQWIETYFEVWQTPTDNLDNPQKWRKDVGELLQTGAGMPAKASNPFPEGQLSFAQVLAICQSSDQLNSSLMRMLSKKMGEAEIVKNLRKEFNEPTSEIGEMSFDPESIRRGTNKRLSQKQQSERHARLAAKRVFALYHPPARKSTKVGSKKREATTSDFQTPTKTRRTDDGGVPVPESPAASNSKFSTRIPS
jgi:hypothetical protein